MNQERTEVYTSFNALKSCGQFKFHDLRGLCAANHDDRKWEHGMELLVTVSNIGLGRPTEPSLVDAIIAERRREDIDRYTFTLKDYDLDTHGADQQRHVTVQVNVRNRSNVGSFKLLLRTPQEQRDWRIEKIAPNNRRVYTIADVVRRAPGAEKIRFDHYTIFDNVTSCVYLDEIGTDYLNCLTEQIEAYAGADMRDLYLKYLAYADAILEEHPKYTLGAAYRTEATDCVKLNVSVFKEPINGNRNHESIAVFEEILKKAGN